MKKMLLAVVAVISIALLPSCMKDYVCTCTSVLPDGTVTNVEKKTFSGTRNSAEDDCKTYEHVNGQVTTTCNID